MGCFKSKKDLLFKLLIVWTSFAFIFFSLTIVYFILFKNTGLDALIFAVMFGLFGIIGFLVWFGFKYVIVDKALKISIVNFTIYEIWISQIVSIEKKRKSTYVYVLSMDCISLKVADGEVNVSPVNTDEFIREILLNNKHTKVADAFIR